MNKKNMNKTSSEHYDLYYFNKSVAERDINKILKLQEACFKDISELLNIKLEFKIEYYLVDSPDLVGEIYGDNEPCNGFAIEPNKIYAVYNDKIKCIGYHEDVHIIASAINKPKSNFIREGLAMYFDKTWWNKSNEEWVKQYISEKKYKKINELFNNKKFLNYSDDITYPIAGAFTKFLIDIYGIKKYLLLYKYKGRNFFKEIKKIYLKDFKKLEQDFLIYIKNK